MVVAMYKSETASLKVMMGEATGVEAETVAVTSDKAAGSGD